MKEVLVLKLDDFDRQEKLAAYLEHCGEKEFVYTLFAADRFGVIKVARIGGSDKNGVLYIGHTTQVLQRIRLLSTSFRERPPNGKLWRHGAEEIYWQNLEIRERYPFQKMWVKVEGCADARDLEYKRIARYTWDFGEVPPFNGAIVKRKKRQERNSQ